MIKWVTVALITTLLIIAGVESNPGPTENVEKTMAGLDSKLNKITEILGKHAEETKMKLEVMDAKWSGIHKEIEEMKMDITKLKEKINEQRWMEKNHRNHNIIVYGMNENMNENRWDVCCAVQELMARELQLNISDMSIDDCYRIGKSKNRRPILVKFTSKLTRDSVLERSKLLKGTGIFLEKDYEKSVRETRKQLIPFMKEARGKGRHAVMRGDKLIVEGRELDLNFCIRNLGEHRREDPGEQPGRERGELSTQAETGQCNNIERRSTHAGGDVSGRILQVSAGSSNTRTSREREQGSQERQVIKERTDRLLLTRERQRSRSNSGGKAGSCRGRQLDNQSDFFITGGASQNRIMRNKGAEPNFYNLRNWVTRTQ